MISWSFNTLSPMETVLESEGLDKWPRRRAPVLKVRGFKSRYDLVKHYLPVKLIALQALTGRLQS